MFPAIRMVPVPPKVSPFVPASTVPMVSVLPVPRLLTLIDGAAPAIVRMFAVIALFPSVQLAAVPGAVSAKTRLPIVRAESSCTVVAAVMSSVLKSADESVPSAMVLPSHALESLQSVPLTSEVHVPLAAWAECETAAASNAIEAAQIDGRRRIPGMEARGAMERREETERRRFFIEDGMG